ncbi:MAG: endonuclease domain-containing protein, partial [Armatimonadetes bacterium]|nr:endonuclease domain-containing protein [Armatimonadota bacterium]
HLLDWRLVIPWLKATAESEVRKGGAQIPLMQGQEWDEARKEGCQSPMELKLLKAIREANLPEPEKQFPICDEQGNVVTIADFAYPEQKLLVYVDGLAFHSALSRRLHDAQIDRWLQRNGYRVLRFIGTEVARNPMKCVSEVREALEMGMN